MLFYMTVLQNVIGGALGSEIMTFSNFKPLGSRFAEIDITTGMLWWKRTRAVLLERHVPVLRTMANVWYVRDMDKLIDTGECEREYYRSKHE